MLDPLTHDTAFTLATIVSEAGVSSPKAWAAVAHVIKNRVGCREWKHLFTPGAVCDEPYAFDGAYFRTSGFEIALNYYANRQHTEPNPHFEQILSTCLPIIEGNLADTTQNALLYYSPHTQAMEHAKNPRYHEKPDWNWNELNPCTVDLDPTDDFSFWTYK